MDIKIECPNCKTQYTPERCGVPVPKSGQRVTATVACVVCKTQFDTAITPAPQLGWWARTVLRRTGPEYTAASSLR